MITLEYEMTYAATIEGPLGPTSGSPLGERLYWQVTTATLRGPRVDATLGDRLGPGTTGTGRSPHARASCCFPQWYEGRARKSLPRSGFPSREGPDACRMVPLVLAASWEEDATRRLAVVTSSTRSGRRSAATLSYCQPQLRIGAGHDAPGSPPRDARRDEGAPAGDSASRPGRMVNPAEWADLRCRRGRAQQQSGQEARSPPERPEESRPTGHPYRPWDGIRKSSKAQV
jgi:hypothetical protein